VLLNCSLIASEASCQVYKNVDPAVFTYGAVDQPPNLTLIGQRPGHSKHVGARVSLFFSPGFNVALLARANRQLSAVFCQRLCDGLANLSVAAPGRLGAHL
jgi:hypothetical protein